MQFGQVYSVEEIPETPKKRKFSLVLFLSVLVILLVIALISTISFFLGRESGKKISNDTSEKTLSLFETTESPTPTGLISSASPTKALSATPQGTLKISLTPTPTPIPKTKLIISSKDLDGYITSTNVLVDNVEIRIGRNQNYVVRGFVSFDISTLPDETKIQSATLRLFQVKVIGSPFSIMGNVKLDHLNYGDILNAEDYSTPAVLSSFNTLSKSNVSEWKEINVMPEVKDDLSNARPTSQFRIHFETETKGDNSTGDFVYFESADNSEGTGNLPQLLIKYY